VESTQRLRNVLQKRAQNLEPEIKRRLLSGMQVVIFGSFAASLERKHSDLDIFCIGESRMHFKSPATEILILPEYDVYSDIWLGSELANHISAYGVPLGPRPDWFDLAAISPAAVMRKEKRIAAYIRSLKVHWNDLSATAKTRYELKIRRELQRLQFLQNGKAVPPTKILDLNPRAFVGSTMSQFHHISNSYQHEIRELFPHSSIAELLGGR
jgi:hypothetical protein